jgi:putative ABC transport system permease protein
VETVQLDGLRAYAERTQDIAAVNRLILMQETRARIARESQINLESVGLDEVMQYVDGKKRAKWLSEVLMGAGAPKHFTSARVLDLATTYVHEHKLEDAVGEGDFKIEGGWLGMSARTWWLIALSFLVCVVGVANALLMSVTERFTEIATMKCLGAMDVFVMILFVFEAMIQGVIGGGVGLVLGFILAVLRGLADLGTLITGATGALGEVGIGMAVSLTIGVGLAALAAVGPSFIAARLPPMEAMRVD